MKKNKIPAIFKEDLQKFLTALGEAEPIAKGQRNCMACARIITIENIQLIIPTSEGYKYVCDDLICIENYNNTVLHE